MPKPEGVRMWEAQRRGPAKAKEGSVARDGELRGVKDGDHGEQFGKVRATWNCEL